MTIWTTFNNQTIVLDDGSETPPANMEAVVLYNRAYVVSDSAGLDKADYVDVSSVAQKLWAAKAEIDARFSGIEEQTSMATLALALNEHAFFISPPGTGKTSIIKGLGQAMAGSYWSIQINDEKTTDDLLGPIDAKAYADKGEYRRKLNGMATSDIVLLDEIWKGLQVSNVTLEPLEERKIAIGDEQITMPLMTALAASNEMPPPQYNAALDRFLLRQVVHYISASDESNFRGMFTAPGLRKPISPVVSSDEIRILAAAVDAASMTMPSDIIDGCVELAKILANKGYEFGPRRWIRTAKAALGWAMLHGETPNLSHLAVARWTLWNDPEEVQEIDELVLGATDPWAGAVLTIRGNLDQIMKQIGALDDSTPVEQRSELTQKLLKLKRETKAVAGDPRAAKYNGELDTILDNIDSAVEQAFG